jgi:hypothetical protein
MGRWQRFEQTTGSATCHCTKFIIAVSNRYTEAETAENAHAKDTERLVTAPDVNNRKLKTIYLDRTSGTSRETATVKITICDLNPEVLRRSFGITFKVTNCDLEPQHDYVF